MVHALGLGMISGGEKRLGQWKGTRPFQLHDIGRLGEPVRGNARLVYRRFGPRASRVAVVTATSD
jgi:hypothetical protein